MPGIAPAFLYDKSVSVKASKDAEHLRLFFYNKGVIGTAWAFLDQNISRFLFPEAVQSGMGALIYLEARLQSDSGNINYTGFKADVSSNAYVDFITKSGSLEAAAQAMAADIRQAIATGQLSAGEVAQLQGILAGLMGDAELAEAYVGQSVDGVDMGKVSANVDEVNPDIAEQEADNSVENSAAIDYNLVKEYIHDIEERTGIKLHKKQIEALKNALRNKEYKRLSPMENSRHRDIFKKIKRELIAEWEEKTGQKWPAYKNDIISRKGRIIRYAGDKYDAHHIIESSFGGDNVWWNIHPASFPDVHQAGIHATNSPASRLFTGGDL